MKNKIVFIIFIAFCLNFTFYSTVLGQSTLIHEPAAEYCTILGYDYKVVTDSTGAEYGICVLPDSSVFNAWSFYRGEVKPEYSYCARKGLTIASITDSSDGFYSKCAFCISNNGRAKITVRDLLIQDGIITDVSESNTDDNIDNVNTDSFFVSNRALTSFPSSFDWKSYNGHSYIGPIRDQGNNCGSCYAFATVASAEGIFNYDWGLYDGNRIELSESFIMWCLGSLNEYHSYFGGCDGATYHRKDVEALTRQGVCLRSLFPYQTSQPDSCYHWNDTKVKFSGWYRIHCNDIVSMKDAIMKYGIIRASVYTDRRFRNYSHGVYKNNDTVCNGNPCEHSLVNHAVAIVGWGTDEDDGEYWIIRNSWGTGWGEDGYMKISMRSAKIACNVAVLIPEPATYISDYATHSSTIFSGHNAKTIGTTEITLSPGFEAEYGSEYVAEIQPAQIMPPTVIDFSDLDHISQYNTKSMLSQGSIPLLDNISLYPNPVHSSIYLNGIPDKASIKVSVFNTSGVLVLSKECKAPNNQIDFETLPEGTYVVSVNVKGQTFVKKIIKK